MFMRQVVKLAELCKLEQMKHCRNEIDCGPPTKKLQKSQEGTINLSKQLERCLVRMTEIDLPDVFRA